MTLAAPHDNLRLVEDFSTGPYSSDSIQSAKGLYLKRDYGQLFLGIILGVILTLLFQYWSKNGFTFPRPKSATDVVDDGERASPTRSVSSGSFRVRGTNVRMRSCPGLDCRELTRLQIGTKVTDLGETELVGDQQWVRVRSGSLEGWVDRIFLE
jgi:hypothetical protein